MKTKKIMAAFLAVILACACVMSFASCNGKTAKYKIGICQLVQHDALDKATQGFKDALIAKLGEENVSFDYQNASGDSATCATIMNQFVSKNVDLIMANATPALQSATAATATIPIVATSVTDYATALGMKEWNGKTGSNVTGSCDLAPLDKQAEMLKELFPNAKNVGIVYCSNEANSKYQATEIAKQFTNMSINSTEYTFSDTNDIASVVTNACANSDVIYIPTDNTAASCAETIDQIASSKNVPIIAGEAGICKGCGVATLSIDYYTLGYKAGEMAAKILSEGANPGEMEIQYTTELTKEYMPERCTKYNITVGDDYKALETSAE